MTVRLAIIGAGIMGGDHARLFAAEIPGVTLQTICDADAARARAVADKVGARHVASDPEAAIRDGNVDAVLIAAPDPFHAPLTLACIAAGKPVLCEKPLSQSTRECLAVMEAEERRGKRLVQIGFMRRFDPSYVEIKNLLASGALGKALMFHCFHRNVAPAYGVQDSMAICNSAPHEFDVARWMLGSDYTSISVFRPGGANAPQSAPVFMVLETAGGQLVDIEVNISAAYGYDVRGELVGEKGSAFLRAPVLADVNLGLKSYSVYPEDWRPRFVEAYRRQNLAWLKSLASGVPAGASAWDGYCATAVAEAGVAALRAGKTVAVEHVAKPGFYA
ncbi:MAG: Gfo/Idh/MocA family oxidoreductase [Methylobacteriaceae bacterium]|nr:Gfo/Idh/MocA family oxidoreductase [Methylobacteriaceae bacterium]